jgi:uncharacterized protein YbaR (Trm112 family)
MDTDFPDFLVCPITRSKLQRQGDFLVSPQWQIKYPIRDGLPILLPSAAILPPEFGTIEELQAAMEEKGRMGFAR